jgi:hypothetical protein
MRDKWSNPHRRDARDYKAGGEVEKLVLSYLAARPDQWLYALPVAAELGLDRERLARVLGGIGDNAGREPIRDGRVGTHLLGRDRIPPACAPCCVDHPFGATSPRALLFGAFLSRLSQSSPGRLRGKGAECTSAADSWCRG